MFCIFPWPPLAVIWLLSNLSMDNKYFIFCTLSRIFTKRSVLSDRSAKDKRPLETGKIQQSKLRGPAAAADYAKLRDGNELGLVTRLHSYLWRRVRMLRVLPRLPTTAVPRVAAPDTRNLSRGKMSESLSSAVTPTPHLLRIAAEMEFLWMAENIKQGDKGERGNFPN